jgi:DNA-binding CsgD family transcriptional regulator
VLASVFKFTPAEVRLAEQVIQGHSPLQSAENLGVTIHTVRTYLKRLYHKAGVRTQAGLVRALMKAIETLPTDI